jgi:RpiR family glv operon transcriptional regulator
MNFYQQTSERVHTLSPTEKNIFNYVTRNLQAVKSMSIRELSAVCYVSSTTLFRCVRKLGYSGYAEFIEAIRETERDSRGIAIPNIVRNDKYRDSYLKNIIEAVKIITEEKMDQFDYILSRYPTIYILAGGLSADVARYFYRLLTTIGYDVKLPHEAYEIKSVTHRIKKEDVLLVLSYTGDNAPLVHQIEEIFAVATPTIVSFTRADNNTIQNMSDLNFYFFADEISYDEVDVTSHVGMIAILEILLYKRITKEKSNQRA